MFFAFIDASISAVRYDFIRATSSLSTNSATDSSPEDSSAEPLSLSERTMLLSAGAEDVSSELSLHAASEAASIAARRIAVIIFFMLFILIHKICTTSVLPRQRLSQPLCQSRSVLFRHRDHSFPVRPSSFPYRNYNMRRAFYRSF